jgi:hypothetical protein
LLKQLVACALINKGGEGEDESEDENEDWDVNENDIKSDDFSSKNLSEEEKDNEYQKEGGSDSVFSD